MKYVFARGGDNNSVIYEDEFGNKYSWIGGTRAWRNNNPGNIRAGDFASRHGSVGTAGGFAVFPDYDHGFSALVALLQTTTYKKLSIEQAINRYAPPIENDTDVYIASVEKQIGVTRNTIMSELSDETLHKLAKAIEKHEGYRQGTIQKN